MAMAGFPGGAGEFKIKRSKGRGKFAPYCDNPKKSQKNVDNQKNSG